MYGGGSSPSSTAAGKTYDGNASNNGSTAAGKTYDGNASSNSSTARLSATQTHRACTTRGC